MFIIFNKRKIYSYLVSFSTVVVLFVIAFTVTTDQSLITSSQVSETQNSDKVSITVENDWNEENVNDVLNILKNNNKKAVFFINQKIIDKFPNITSQIINAGHEININNV